MNILISNLHSVFNWVINSSIKVSVLIVIILLIRVLFKGKISPKLNHILWLIVILRVMIPDIYRSDLSIYKFAPVVVNEGMTIVDTSNNIAGEINVKDTQTATENVISNDGDNPYSNKTNLPAKAINFRDISFIVWLIGLITILGTTLIINIIFVRKIRKETIIKNHSVIRIFDRCKEEMGISKNIILIETKEVKVLGLLGFFSPKILFPVGLIDKLDEDSLRYVLLHELSHLKRRDILSNWTISILTAFHWFNPIVWYGFYKMREDSELCCDSLVMTHLKNEETTDYGYTIIKLVENLSTKTPMLVTASIASNKSQTKRRINMIKLFKKYPYRLSAAAILIIVIVGTIAFVGAENNINTNSGLSNWSEVVIYSAHSNEHYKDGLSAFDTGKKLTEILTEQGLKCEFLEVPINTERLIAYDTSRLLIKSNIENYSKKVLLDVQITFGLWNVLDQTIPKEVIENEGIKIILGKKNPNFKENDKFANMLLKELKKNNTTKASIEYVEDVKYNQDLSPKALNIELGSSNLTREEIDDYLNALAVGLKGLYDN